MVKTDIIHRALPWARLILETRNLPNDLNLKLDQRLSFALVAFACVFLFLAAARPAFLNGTAAALLGVAIINRELYTLFYRHGGLWFATASVALHFLYYLYSGLTYSWAWADFQLRRMAQSR